MSNLVYCIGVKVTVFGSQEITLHNEGRNAKRNPTSKYLTSFSKDCQPKGWRNGVRLFSLH